MTEQKTNVDITRYNDGITAKWFNKRTTIVEKENGIRCEFLTLNPEKKETVCQKNIHGITISAFELSLEAAEVLHKLLTEILSEK